MTALMLSGAALRRSLAVRDLTDPTRGPHAIQLLIDDVTGALTRAWGVQLTLHRSSPVVSVDDNYDALLYPDDGKARDGRYSRWVSPSALLRTQTSAALPPLLRARAPDGLVDDELLACPGLVYRRDCIDRLHVGEPHQLDLWRLARGSVRTLDDGALDEMIALVLGALLPGRRWRANPAQHPYTERGRELEIDVDGAWIEVGECGLARPEVLARAGIDVARVSGLAMGLGLDRVLMVRKGIDDIRLLRAADPRIARQMLDLSPYRPVSKLPSVTRDLSLVVDDVAAEADSIGDRVRAALGDDAEIVEEVQVLSTTPHAALPAPARQRLQTCPGQSNVLVRVVLRPLTHTLTDDDGNRLRDRIYAAVHQGAVQEWAAARPSSTP